MQDKLLGAVTILILLVVIFLMSYGLVNAVYYDYKFYKVNEQVKNFADKLDSLRGENGLHLRTNERLVDTFGKEVLVTYTIEGLEVRSSGLDELFYTRDDVVETRVLFKKDNK